MPKPVQKSPDLNIDLLPKESLISSSNTAVHWALTVGRYLVIVTEIIALATFLLGIYLAKEKNDLKDSIKNKQATVDNLQKCDENDLEAFCEERFRKVQNQINQVAAIRSSQFEHNDVLTEFTKLMPIGLVLDSMLIDGRELTFSGVFPNPTQLQTMIDTFNKSGLINNLDITTLAQERPGEYKFSAVATINKAAFNNSN